MKIPTAAVAACLGALVLALTATSAFAINDPIPGVDIIVKKIPLGISEWATAGRAAARS